jgi:hypothetical protein
MNYWRWWWPNIHYIVCKYVGHRMHWISVWASYWIELFLPSFYCTSDKSISCIKIFRCMLPIRTRSFIHWSLSIHFFSLHQSHLLTALNSGKNECNGDYNYHKLPDNGITLVRRKMKIQAAILQWTRTELIRKLSRLRVLTLETAQNSNNQIIIKQQQQQQ